MGGGYQRSRHRAWDTSAPQNELRFFIVDALRKRFQANPVPGYTGEPTEVELGDVQATADPFWKAFVRDTSKDPGTTPDNPIHGIFPSKPFGPFSEFNPFAGSGGRMEFYFNDFGRPIDPPPPPPPPPPVDPPKDPPPAPAPCNLTPYTDRLSALIANLQALYTDLLRAK
jgi:hypothetical protein